MGQYLYALIKVKLSHTIWHVALIIIIKAFHQTVRRPLCIDITANVITVPEQLVGYTLTLSNGEDSYTYIFSGTTLSIPQGISGEYELTVTNGNVCYQGEVEI